jgi:uncharacterized protein (DUF983 family)
MPIQLQPPSDPAVKRAVWPAMRRGFAQTCPSCGTAPLFRKFLKSVDACAACGAEMHHHRADDAPPYFTMFVVGHVVIGGMLFAEKRYAPETWMHLAVWLPLTALLSLWLLPRFKGALIGLQWALRMHGFDAAGRDPAAPESHPALRHD